MKFACASLRYVLAPACAMTITLPGIRWKNREPATGSRGSSPCQPPRFYSGRVTRRISSVVPRTARAAPPKNHHTAAPDRSIGEGASSNTSR